jgi:hypothetical protein
MKPIKFSHRYCKQRHIDIERPVLLLEVFNVRTEDLSPSFISYDTLYDEHGSKKHYELPKGEALVLLFCDSDYNTFTTVRRFTKSKETFYKFSRGEYFKVEVTDDETS